MRREAAYIALLIAVISALAGISLVRALFTAGMISGDSCLLVLVLFGLRMAYWLLLLFYWLVGLLNSVVHCLLLLLVLEVDLLGL